MFGLKDFQAAAIVGVWMREGFGSGFPDVIQGAGGGTRGAPTYNAPQDKGYGMGQWTNTQGGGPNDRLNRAMIYLGMKDNPRPWTVDDNLKIFKWEVETKGYGTAISELKKTTNLTDAVRTFAGIYEAGGIRNLAAKGAAFIDVRVSSAKGVLKYMTSGKDDQGKTLETASFSDIGTEGSLGNVKGYSVTRNGQTIKNYSQLPPHHDYTTTSDGRRVQDMTLYKGKEFLNIPVPSPVSGKVSWAGPTKGGGNWVEVQSDDGKVELGHFNKIVAKPGQRVEAFKTVLGLQGHTGRISPPGIDGTHLHIQAPDKVVSRYVNSLAKGGAAYAKGGETLAGPHLAMLGEKGSEIVVDADSSGPARDMLLAINQAKDHKGVMKAIQQYAPYDVLSPQTIVMPSSGGESDYDSGMSGGGVMMMDGGGGDSYDPFDALEMGG